MTINHTRKCEGCAEARPTDAWVEIGQDVHINGGDAGDTNHAFFQCQACGSVIVRIRDIGGMGGNGAFHQLLTRGLY